MPERKTDADFLVIGSGIAGLFAALKLADAGSVIIVTKRKRSDSNTAWAQGGIASVLSETDSFEEHIRDTLEAGAGLCRPDAVRKIVERGPSLIRELAELGVPFTRTEEGEFDLGREGGHRARRIVHVKDMTGFYIERTLLEVVAQKRNILLLENHAAIDLITEHHV
ncbi:MAG: FAD-dependent oxidoreductase, partial [candidate division KSB1 bacterium]|nr:FAD-dependent oxidoreductase [candidate division KSB1 bacterium]